MLFMAAMLGISLSNNLIILLVFWELTSISSFLLVGYWSHYEAAQRGSRMALTITGMGGLAMLGGFVLLGQITGTYEISEIMGMKDAIQAHTLLFRCYCLFCLAHLRRVLSFHFILVT